MESKSRIESALKKSGFEWPRGHITVNLAPANIPKKGTALDLAIAIGILIESKQVVNSSDAEMNQLPALKGGVSYLWHSYAINSSASLRATIYFHP